MQTCSAIGLCVRKRSGKLNRANHARFGVPLFINNENDPFVRDPLLPLQFYTAILEGVLDSSGEVFARLLRNCSTRR